MTLFFKRYFYFPNMVSAYVGKSRFLKYNRLAVETRKFCPNMYYGYRSHLLFRSLSNKCMYFNSIGMTGMHVSFQTELEESARSSATVTTPTPPTISTPSPPTPSSHDLLTTGVEDDMERGTTPVPSPSSPMERRRSVMETIYAENKVCV